MSNLLTPILIVEGGMGIIFCLLLVYLRKRLGILDALLWLLVWCTRVFASLNGLSRFQAASPELNAYLGLQALSAIALIIILIRSQFQIIKERFVKSVLLRVSSSES